MGSHVLPNGVTLHCDWNDPWLPSIDVKMGLWSSRHSFPDADDVVARTGCCENCARRAIENAFDVHQELFWYEAKTKLVKEAFGEGACVWACGRSGGWLSVTGIGQGQEVEVWSNDEIEAWRYFEENIEAAIAEYCAIDFVLDTIEEFDWLEGCHLLIEQHAIGMGGEL